MRRLLSLALIFWSVPAMAASAVMQVDATVTDARFLQDGFAQAVMDFRYWNGRPVSAGRASHVDLLTGSPHGLGGNLVQSVERGVCVR